MKKFKTFIIAILFSTLAFATTVREKTVTCGSCGADVKVSVIMSTSRFGYMDLDTRPPPPERDNYRHHLQMCKACGYCAIVITNVPNAQVRAYLKKNPFSQVELRSLGSAYQRTATLQAIESPQTFAPAMLALTAAWAADDAEEKESARQHRKVAIGYLQLFLKTKDARIDHWLIVGDVQRRIGDFVAAKQTFEAIAQRKEINSFLRRIVAYELSLIQKKDDGRHSVGEAMKEKDK